MSAARRGTGTCGRWHGDLTREFRFRDFYRTMSFVNALAHVANIEDHHPDLEVGYNYCRVRYSTHAIGGLSENDFICAAKIDQLPAGLIGTRRPSTPSTHRQPGQLALEPQRTARQQPAG